MIRHLLLLAIRSYRFLAPGWTRGSCRHVPTCSSYAYEAIERYGAGRGVVFAVRRLLRCHPLGSRGWDPLP